MQHGGANISTTVLGRCWWHHNRFIRMYLLNKVDASRLGAVKVCVYVTDRAPPCDLDVSHPLGEKSDTRHPSKNMQLGSCTPPLWSSATTIIKLLLPGCEGLSHRQPESGGSPIAFVHFSPSFSAEHLLPPGWVRPVPVSLRLDSTEATAWKALRRMPTTSLRQGSASPTHEQSNSYWVCITLRWQRKWKFIFV